MKNQNKHHYKTLFSIAILALLLLVIIPQVSGLKSSFTSVLSANKYYMVLAIMAQFFNYVFSSFVYISLSKKRLYFKRTLLVEWAGGLTNRLLPAGLGALGLSALYLIKNKYSIAQASAIVLLNNTLGVMGNIALVLLFTAIAPTAFSFHINGVSSRRVILGFSLFLAISFGLTKVSRINKRLTRALKELQDILRHYSKYPSRLGLAFLGSMAITICHALVLYFASKSIGVSIPFSGALLAMSAGNIVGAVTPTPGGLVGVETGLTAGLVAQGVSASPALAIALIYRFVTYWFPIIPGFICLKISQHKRYI